MPSSATEHPRLGIGTPPPRGIQGPQQPLQRGFHVRLDGPPERRVAQGASIEHVSLDDARVHMQAADNARTSYVRCLYRADPADASLYHLVIDSIAIPLQAVTELILSAAQSAAAG
jgi:cytidylate kinase